MFASNVYIFKAFIVCNNTNNIVITYQSYDIWSVIVSKTSLYIVKALIEF